MPDRTNRPRRQPEILTTRERLLRGRTETHDAGAAPYAVAYGLLLFLLIGAAALWQVSAEAPGRRLLEPFVASITDIDAYLAEQRDNLDGRARSTEPGPFALPGFPLDVRVTKQEASLPPAQLRPIVVDRAVRMVYAGGLGAFDRTGDQSLGTFSDQGLLGNTLGRVNMTTHDRMQFALYVLVPLTLLAAFGVVLKQSGTRRMRLLGVATIAGAVPAGALAVLGQFLAGEAWRGDPFEDELSDIVTRIFDVLLRDAVVALALGVFLVLAAVILGAAEGWWARRSVDEQERRALQPSYAGEAVVPEDEGDEPEADDEAS